MGKKKAAGKKKSAGDTHVCPAVLMYEMNGIYYWYAVRCPSMWPEGMSSNNNLQVGCSQLNNPPHDCEVIPKTSKSSKSSKQSKHSSPRSDLHWVGTSVYKDGIANYCLPNELFHCCKPDSGFKLRGPDFGRFQDKKKERYFVLYAALMVGETFGQTPPVLLSIGQEMKDLSDIPSGSVVERLTAAGPAKQKYIRLKRQSDLFTYHCLMK